MVNSYTVCRFLCIFIVFTLFNPLLIVFAEDQTASASVPDILPSISSLRSKEAQSRLEEDPLLRRTAQKYAELMVKEDHFSHVGPDGQRGVDRVKEEGGTWIRIGEIIGIGPDKSSIFKAWMRSTPHRDMILDNRWTHGGAGLARRGEEILCVVLFAETEGLQILIEEDEDSLVIETNDWYERLHAKESEEDRGTPLYFVEVREKRFLEKSEAETRPHFMVPKNLFEGRVILLRFGITYSNDPSEGKMYHHFLYQ